MTHLMALTAASFEDVKNEAKTHIVVKNQRPYNSGDILVLQDDFDPRKEMSFTIKSVDESSDGLKSGYCILSF